MHIASLTGFTMSQHAPCGAKITSLDMKEKIASSTEELERVTCPYCRGAIRETAKKFNKARRLKTITWVKEQK